MALTTQLRLEVRQFLRTVAFQPALDSWLTSPSPDFSRALGERGWIGMTWPREFGGGESTSLRRWAVIEELLAAGAPLAAHWFAERQIGPSILRNGTAEQRRFYLPRIAAGECYFAVGMSEPDSGSDLASVTTRAVRVDDGWRITGRKLWTTGADLAHYILTLCRAVVTDTTPAKQPPKHANLCQIIVPLAAKGVSVRPIAAMNGHADFSEVVFDDVLVPADHLLGRTDAGWSQVTGELSLERGGPERYLSWFPLVRDLAVHVSADRGSEQLAMMGTIAGQLWSVRSLALMLAADADLTDRRRGGAAALSKDLGTSYERAMLEKARLTMGFMLDDKTPSSLAAAIMKSPGITLRGGTSEILRDMIWRDITSGRTQ